VSVFVIITTADRRRPTAEGRRCAPVRETWFVLVRVSVVVMIRTEDRGRQTADKTGKTANNRPR